jgi:hypothetical protein
LCDPSSSGSNLLWHTGENCTTQVVQIPSPPGTIEDYMTALGLTGGLDGFMAQARLQERHNWDERFTARAVLNWLRADVGLSPLPAGSRRILYEINPQTGIAAAVAGWDHYDFTGIEIDPATDKIYGVSTRRHGTDSTTAIYDIDPVTGPVEPPLAMLNIAEMQGLAIFDDLLFITSGEDRDIQVYDTTGLFIGTIPTPISKDAQPSTEHHLGGTYGGAAILDFPWPQ